MYPVVRLRSTHLTAYIAVELDYIEFISKEVYQNHVLATSAMRAHGHPKTGNKY